MLHLGLYNCELSEDLNYSINHQETGFHTLYIFCLKTQNFEQAESESLGDTMISIWHYIAGAATFIFTFAFVVVTVCCIFHKRNREPHYANTRSQHVQNSSQDQTIYENDHEFKKKTCKKENSQISSVYINRPENMKLPEIAIYANTTANPETYENCPDNDYENVEICDRRM